MRSSVSVIPVLGAVEVGHGISVLSRNAILGQIPLLDLHTYGIFHNTAGPHYLVACDPKSMYAQSHTPIGIVGIKHDYTRRWSSEDWIGHHVPCVKLPRVVRRFSPRSARSTRSMRRVREGRTRRRSVSSAWSLITLSDGSPARLKLGAAAQARQSERERTNSTGNAPFVGGLGVPMIDGAVTSTTSSTRSSAMHGSSTTSTLATISSLVVWPSTKTPRLSRAASISWRRVHVVVIDLRTQL